MTALGQSVFFQALGWAVLNSLWQMALLWVLYQFITATSRKIKSGQKTNLASFMLITGFAWFLFTFFSILINPTDSTILAESSVAGAVINEKFSNWFQKTLPAAAFAYILLLIFPVIHFRRNYRYINAIRNQGLSKIHVDWRIFTKKMAAIIGIKRPVKVWLSDLVSSPLTIGFLKPIILIPAAAVNHLSTQQMEAVLLHELAHIRRYDFLLNLLISGIQTLLYFNPFVKLFVKTIEREREKSCDETVMQFQYDRRGYATALLLLEKNHVAKSLVVAASGNKNDLLHRIEKILGVNKKQVFSFNKLAGVFAGLLFAIGLNAVLILNKPENGNSPSVSLTHFSSPFYLYTDERLPQPDKKQKIEPATIAQFEKQQASKPKSNEVVLVEEKVSAAIPAPSPQPKKAEHFSHKLLEPSFINVSMPIVTVTAPKLKEYQEQQVKQAIDASKRIIEEAQWKAVEKNIADAFTKNEKEEFKSLYQESLASKIDWKVWENKLKTSYNNINWHKINEQLNHAIVQIKFDSLQNVYLEALDNLSSLQLCLKQNNQTCIPDSDITLEKLEQNEVEVKKALNTIKGIKSRKIIRL